MTLSSLSCVLAPGFVLVIPSAVFIELLLSSSSLVTPSFLTSLQSTSNPLKVK
jgi:hypothetical protein